MDHPMIEQIERTGYANLVKQPDHNGFDAFGDEIMVGETIYLVGDEAVLEDNLERYLVEMLGFEIREAQ